MTYIIEFPEGDEQEVDEVGLEYDEMGNMYAAIILAQARQVADGRRFDPRKVTVFDANKGVVEVCDTIIPTTVVAL